ncbi:MAG: GntR family transcriptional regulator [Rhodospirillales bacterium]|nr:GntR family transcriptional regulator [Rhodospirillales bacterium]
MKDDRHQTLRERTYDEIVRLIMSGELEAGALIDEKLLIARLASSRTPFREAIGSLAKDGLVEIRPYRGCYVRVLTFREVKDLYDLRQELEAFAVRLAVPRLSAEDIAWFERTLDLSVAALAENDMAAYATHDRAFHERIAELSGNHALVESLARLKLQVQLCRVLANHDATFAERAAWERDQILVAFRAGDAAGAAALMREHIADVRGAVLAALGETKAAEAGPSIRSASLNTPG